MNKPTHYQHLRHCNGNDTNGNPRRLFVLYDAAGAITKVIDEGYRGMPEQVRELIQLPGYFISAGDYRELKRSL